MKYLILIPDDPGWKNKPLFAKIDSRVDFALSRALWDSLPLQSHPKLSFSIPKAAPLPDFLSTGTTLWLFSQKLLRLLRAMGVNFESFPIILHDRKGNLLNYEIELFHLLQICPIIDQNRSVIQNSTHIEKIELVDMGIEPEYSMIRDSYLRSRVFVREDLYDAMIREGITGCSWLKPSEYKFILDLNREKPKNKNADLI